MKNNLLNADGNTAIFRCGFNIILKLGVNKQVHKLNIIYSGYNLNNVFNSSLNAISNHLMKRIL